MSFDADRVNPSGFTGRAGHDPAQHPRATDGKFVVKQGAPAEFTLGAYATLDDVKNFRELDYVWRRDMRDRAAGDPALEREITDATVERGNRLQAAGVFATDFDQMAVYEHWDKLNAEQPSYTQQTEEIVHNPNEYTDEEIFDTLAAATAAGSHDSRFTLISVLQDRGVTIPQDHS